MVDRSRYFGSMGKTMVGRLERDVVVFGGGRVTLNGRGRKKELYVASYYERLEHLPEGSRSSIFARFFVQNSFIIK